MEHATPLSPILYAKVLGSSGGGGTPHAVLYTAQTLSAAQQEQARTNIGAVSADDIGSVFTIKGSVATVADLPATGNSVGDVYYVEAVSAGYVWITSTEHPTGYWEELGEPIDLSAYELKPTVEGPTGASVTITPADNTIYKCGTLDSLTITNSPVSGAYCIVFTSSATPTVTTFPATILGLENFAAEANTLYEINVLDNRAVVGSWAVSV